MITMKKLRASGIVLAILFFLTNFKLQIPVAASQGSISFGFAEIMIICAGIYLLYLLLTKKYVLKKFSLYLFVATVACGAVTVAVGLIHVFQGSSVFEYVGVIRNLYACVLLYFLVDAKTISPTQLLHATVLFSLALLAINCYNGLQYVFKFPFPEYRYPDEIYIAVAVIPIIGMLIIKNSYTKKMKWLYVATTSVSLFSSLMVGSRAASTFTMVAIIVTAVVLFFAVDKKIIIHAICAILITSVTISLILVSPYKITALTNLTRASSVSRTIYMAINGITLPDSNGEIPLETDIPDSLNGKDDMAALLGVTKGSGQRSNFIRGTAWKAFGEKIKQSPVIGFGSRFIEIESVDHSKMSVNPHNFILEITALFGVIGTAAYLLLMAFVFIFCVFKTKGKFPQKILLLMACGMLYAFAMVQPSITGGLAANIVVWALLTSYLKDESQTDERKLLWKS